MNKIETIGQIADLKDTGYKNALAVSVLIELLIDKGLFTRQEFAAKASRVDRDTLAEAALLCRMNR
ncbi:MAG: hypothetical protein ABFC84_09525 [Veillonellales bacterium]